MPQVWHSLDEEQIVPRFWKDPTPKRALDESGDKLGHWPVKPLNHPRSEFDQDDLPVFWLAVRVPEEGITINGGAPHEQSG